MKILEKNVVNVWGDEGRKWLRDLPQIINTLVDHWHLTGISPVNNMSYNYVAFARQNKSPVVLKISCDKELIQDEYKTLKYFNGHGSIKIIDGHPELNALLLEQAIPGNLLKESHRRNINDTITIYADVVKALAKQDNPNNKFPHVKKWCQAIDCINDTRVKTEWIVKAKEIRDFLLSSAENEYLCHGDLHLENIIQHHNSWLSIDPKGIIGELAFEAAAFDLLEQGEWNKPNEIQEKIITRIDLLAGSLNVDKARLLAWVFLRIVISAQWFIEDNGDPNDTLRLATELYPIIQHQ